MSYDDQPWKRFYDEWVDPEMEIPGGTYTERINEAFAQDPGKVAYHFLGSSTTFSELDQLSRRFARYLADSGVEPGSVVAINLPNIPQYMIALAGALRSGCAVTGLSPLLTPSEMSHQLNDCGAQVLVTLDAIFEHRLLSIKGELSELQHVVTTSVGTFMPWLKRTLGRLLKKIPSGNVCPLDGKQVSDFMSLMKRFPAELPEVKINPEDICLIQYTGGTTGASKGAEITHANLVANLMMVNQWLKVEPGNALYCSAFPFFHMAGLALCLSGMALGNTQILIPDPRNTGMICKSITKYAPTHYANVPSLYQLLLDDPAFPKLDFSPAKVFLSAAAPIPAETLKALDEIVGSGKVFEAYGMTETSPIITINPASRQKPGSVGIPIPHTRVKLIDLDDESREVPIGGEGEIIVQGPQVMKGYHNLPDESAHALRLFDGEPWMHTGDVGRMDEEGYLFLVDRSKDMLNVSGFKVFSREVEDKLYKHPAIELCAIIGIPNTKRPGSELVKLVIQLKKEHKRDDRNELEEDIIGFCKEHMAPYKVPKIVTFVDEIPLTAVGKVDKKTLR